MKKIFAGHLNIIHEEGEKKTAQQCIVYICNDLVSHANPGQEWEIQPLE